MKETAKKQANLGKDFLMNVDECWLNFMRLLFAT